MATYFPDTTDTLIATDLAPLRAEAVASGDRRREAVRRRQDAERGTLRATREDALAYADAMRAGGTQKDPGPRHVEALKVELADATRVEAGEVAIQARIEADVEDMREERQAAWLADLASQRAGHVSVAAEAFDVAAAAILAVVALDTTRRWVLTGQEKSAIPRTPDGKPLGDSLNSIRALLASWEPSDLIG